MSRIDELITEVMEKFRSTSPKSKDVFRGYIPSLCDAISIRDDKIVQLESEHEELSKEFNALADGLYTAHKAREYLADRDRWKARAETAETELAAYREAEHKSCEYKIHIPSEEGYPDVKGRFYECSCGANYIDIEAGQEWQRCPHCGKPISSFETLACISCNNSEWDGDSYYCEAKSGTYHGEEVTHANFDGCKSYEPRKEADVALQRR